MTAHSFATRNARVESVLELVNDDVGGITCCGQTKLGRRCRNTIRHDNIVAARRQLAQLPTDFSDSRSVLAILKPAASCLLCVRWHQDQASEVVNNWLRLLKTQPSATPSISQPSIEAKNASSTTIKSGADAVQALDTTSFAAQLARAEQLIEAYSVVMKNYEHQLSLKPNLADPVKQEPALILPALLPSSSTDVVPVADRLITGSSGLNEHGYKLEVSPSDFNFGKHIKAESSSSKASHQLVQAEAKVENYDTKDEPVYIFGYPVAIKEEPSATDHDGLRLCDSASAVNEEASDEEYITDSDFTPDSLEEEPEGEDQYFDETDDEEEDHEDHENGHGDDGDDDDDNDENPDNHGNNNTSEPDDKESDDEPVPENGSSSYVPQGRLGLASLSSSACTTAASTPTKHHDWESDWKRYREAWTKLALADVANLTIPLCDVLPWPVRNGRFDDVTPAAVEEFFTIAPGAVIEHDAAFGRLMRREKSKWLQARLVDRFGYVLTTREASVMARAKCVYNVLNSLA